MHAGLLVACALGCLSALHACSAACRLQGCRQQLCAEGKKRCRHWRYELTGAEVDRVQTSRDGKRAVIEATLAEGGELVGEGGAVLDSYRATFTQEYKARRLRGKGWRMVGSKLVF